jgi:DNA polymerase-3 subunit delta
MTIHLLRGKDDALLGAAVTELVRELVGDDDRDLLVDEFDDDEYDVATVVASAQTPPFLTDRRIVVARGLDRFNADALRGLSAYLAEPMHTTDLVLATSGAPPKHLVDALKRAGATQRDTDAPSRAKDRRRWFDEQLELSGLRLDPGAAALVLDQLGEDVGRLTSLLATLESTFGSTKRLGVDDVRPFLGEAGGVPPWDLTDAVDRGDTEAALVALRRMQRAGDRHPLQVMAVLHNHFVRVLRLDGTDAGGEKDAAAILGIAPFQARKALDQYRRLGHDGVVRAFSILAQADLDLRGESDLPGEVVMEVAVARLSRLAPAPRRTPSRR